jgi:hypothetical protein
MNETAVQPRVAKGPLSTEELRKMNAYWRAANYLSVGQIYLLDNPLLQEPLTLAHVKPRLLGHWGTTPGLNFLYVHLNRIINKYDLDVLYVAGPGHGGPGPFEASGTSGMKAAFNGVPSLSVLDGWWIEGYIEGVTGWAIGNAAGADNGDARALYDKLEQVVLPLYYGYSDDPGGWVKVMKGAICKNASYFNSHRMMRRYVTEAYIR